MRVVGRLVYLVSVEILPLYLSGHKMVSHQVSTNSASVWNVAQRVEDHIVCG